ncbi:MAG: septal ring lytic transglycosylase RlpA family protein [Alphaproteobacteria bacterium]|nr:septal ring lytic transglycosylase RlpA family protein [Alphaproteobacteria bacterium]
MILLAVAGLFAGAEGTSAGPTKTSCSAARSACVSGIASWYGRRFQGHRTASGEPFDRTQMTAAHPSLPFATRLRITNLANGRTVTVRVNDRGPGLGRIVDVSEAAAERLGMKARGFARVEMQVE